MILSWKNFLNEELKVSGIKKFIRSNKEDDFMFASLDDSMRDIGSSLKKVIKKVSEKLGLSKVKAFKSGSYGVVFTTEDKILKITTDDEEAAMVDKIIQHQKKFKLKNIAKYHKIFSLKIKGNNEELTPYWVITMEKITPISSKKLIDTLLFFDMFLVDEIDKNITEDKEPNIDKILKKIEKAGYSKYKRYVYDMVGIIDNYRKIDLKNSDIHVGNIGINSKGKMVSFDPRGYITQYRKLENIKI